MTVGTNNIAFSDLRKQYITSLTVRSDTKRLKFSRPMIKIHADWMKLFPAVGAGNILKGKHRVT